MSGKISWAVLGLTVALSGCGGGGSSGAEDPGPEAFELNSTNFSDRDAAFRNMSDVATSAPGATVPTTGSATYLGAFRMGVPVPDPSSAAETRTEEVIGRAEVNVNFANRNLSGTLNDMVGSTNPQVAGSMTIATPAPGPANSLRGRADGRITIDGTEASVFLNITDGVVTGDDARFLNSALRGGSGFSSAEVSGDLSARRR